MDRLVPASVLAVAVSLVCLVRARMHKKKLPANDESIEPHKLAHLFDVGGLFGLDIGGSLAKLIFFEPDADILEQMSEAKQNNVARITAFIHKHLRYGRTGCRDADLSMYSDVLGGTLHFIRFHTSRVLGAVAMTRRLNFHVGLQFLCATGGGAHKFATSIQEELNCKVIMEDELGCLVQGLIFMLRHVADESYTFRDHTLVSKSSETIEYPYLIVNVGSGVSIILVESPTSWRRVSGSSIGGATYYGLCHMITGVISFDEMLKLAEQGDNKEVDLTVGDIYGGDYDKIGLSSSTIASSFGKAIHAVPHSRHAATSPHEGRAPVSWNAREVETANELARRAHIEKRRRLLRALRTSIRYPNSVTGSDIQMSWPGRISNQHDNTTFNQDEHQRHTRVSTLKAIEELEAELQDMKREIQLREIKETDTDASQRSSRNVHQIEALDDENIAEQGVGSVFPLANDDSNDSEHKSIDTKPQTTPFSVSGDKPILNVPLRQKNDNPTAPAFKPAAKDISRGLLIMISNNLGQIAYLNAQHYSCKRVFFAGNFLRHHNTVAMRTLSYAIDFWSQGEMEALFLRHEGYFGAIGAFLSTIGRAAADSEPDLLTPISVAEEKTF